jgi:uncharacterized Zn-binding protein involved in type VI secretion
MPAVARIGDPISHGGAIIEGSPNVFANGAQVARIGDAVYCDIHKEQVIVSGSGTVFANGSGVAREGDEISCGAVIIQGSPNVFAG